MTICNNLLMTILLCTAVNYERISLKFPFYPFLVEVTCRHHDGTYYLGNSEKLFDKTLINPKFSAMNPSHVIRFRLQFLFISI